MNLMTRVSAGTKVRYVSDGTVAEVADVSDEGDVTAHAQFVDESNGHRMCLNDLKPDFSSDVPVCEIIEF